MTMHWRRIDGVNEPEHIPFGDDCRRAPKRILVAAGELIEIGLFYILQDGRQLFAPEKIDGIPLTHFMEIDPTPTGEAEKQNPQIIDTAKYGRE
jgi:hypothetical protein